MRYIIKEFLNCDRCGLCKFRKNVVFGRGRFPADLCFIGMGPGEVEDHFGVPFVGPSGNLLDEAIRLASEIVTKKEPPSYFITNVVACRPTNSKYGENRDPTMAEAYSCWERLDITVNKHVRPKRIVLLGQVTRRLCLKVWPSAFVLAHPAAILRAGGQSSPQFKKFIRDLAQVFEEVHRAR